MLYPRSWTQRLNERTVAMWEGNSGHNPKDVPSEVKSPKRETPTILGKEAPS